MASRVVLVMRSVPSMRAVMATWRMRRARLPMWPALLFTEQPPAAHPAVDLVVLRTDLEALDLTAEQRSRLGRAGQRLAALRKDANQRAHQAPAGGASGAQDAPDAHRQDEQHAYRQHPHERDRGHGASH